MTAHLFQCASIRPDHCFDMVVVDDKRDTVQSVKKMLKGWLIRALCADGEERHFCPFHAKIIRAANVNNSRLGHI